jgi:hypothetical protein
MLSFMPGSTKWLAHLFPKAGDRAGKPDTNVRFLAINQQVPKDRTSPDLPVGEQHSFPGSAREPKPRPVHSTFVLSGIGPQIGRRSTGGSAPLNSAG